MNSGKKILISRRVSSRKTPETASAAKHGLRKHLTVFLQAKLQNAGPLIYISVPWFRFTLMDRALKYSSSDSKQYSTG